MNVYLAQVAHMWNWDQPEVVGIFASKADAADAAEHRLQTEYPLGKDYVCRVTEYVVQECFAESVAPTAKSTSVD